MKRAVTLLLVFVLMFGIIGCSSAPAEETVVAEAAEPAEPTAEPTVEPTEAPITEFDIGETVSTDIIEATIERADLAIALDSTIGSSVGSIYTPNENYMLPEEYNAEEHAGSPFVAQTGHTLVAFTCIMTNIDRGGTLSLGGTSGVMYISVEYDGQIYDTNTYGFYEPDKFDIEVCLSEGGGTNWDGHIYSSYGNFLLSAGETTTVRGYMNIPVETESLNEPFTIILHLPTSSGETTNFAVLVNGD